MAKLTVGDQFPPGSLKDIDGVAVDFPAVFKNAPSTPAKQRRRNTRVNHSPVVRRSP